MEEAKDQETKTIEDIEHVDEVNNNTIATLEERAEALREAQKLDPGMPTYSWRSCKFALSLLTVCICSGDNGELICMDASQTRL